MNQEPIVPDLAAICRQHEESYRDWQATHVFRQAHARLYEARIATWPEQPHFHLAVIQKGTSNEALTRTIQSLARQYYPHLTVTVVADVAAPVGLTGERLRWISAPGHKLAADTDIFPSTAAKSDWLGVVHAGDEVPSHAFLLLAESALSHPEWLAVYSDEDRIDGAGNRREPRFKPDFDVEFLRAAAYIGGLLLMRPDAWRMIGGWQALPQEGIFEFEIALRLTEHATAIQIGHIADILYHRGDHPATMESTHDARKAGVSAHLSRLGIKAQVEPGLKPGLVAIHYPMLVSPRVSIIIPTKDHLPLLQRCIDSLVSTTDYPDYEILVVDNGTVEPSACHYLDALNALADPRVRVLTYDAPFNFAAMNNLAADAASGDFLLLLNNDTAVVHHDWLRNMVSLAQQPNVGMVGARLLFPNGTIQHAGVVLGMAGPAEHPFITWPADADSPMHRLHATQQVSTVTAACALIPRHLYADVGGMDAESLKVSYNDVDLCLKIRKRGLRILWTPYSTLLHEGSASQSSTGGAAAPASSEAVERFIEEQHAMYQRWMPQLTADPAFNPNLSLESRNYNIEPEAALSWNPTPWRPLPRVVAHPADLTGCGEYRVLAPTRGLVGALRLSGFASMRFFSATESAKADLDAIIVQRPITARHVAAIEVYRRHSTSYCIAELDDLVTDLPKKSPHRNQIPRDAGKWLVQALAKCHRLVVSSEQLAHAYRHLTDEVVVRPNCLDGSQWQGLRPLRQTSPRPRVGWAGSESHIGDLELIADVVRQLSKQVDWIFCGQCPASLRPYAKEIHAGVPFSDYPAKLAALNLDLAIAPLELNAFNEAKSSLKVLEYGILGFPVVCTDIAPYQGEYPVTRVRNTTKAWTEAILGIAEDPKASAMAGEQLRNHVTTHWLLEQHLDACLSAWLP
jgi:GT2 family glycosyltransferase